MQSGEIVGTEQLAAITLADAARWLLAVVVVAALGTGLARLATDWAPPAGDHGQPAPPAILLELALMPVPEPEPVAEPEVEPLPPEPEPEPEREPEPQPEPESVVEPTPEPLPSAEEPPEPVVPPVEPEPLPAPTPVPEPEAPAVALPVTMSAALQQRRRDTPATTFQPTSRPRSEPAPSPAAARAPQQATPPSQPAADTGPTPEQWQQQVLRYLDRRKQYPRDAERAGEEGVVAISFTIDASGRVLSASVARSSGYPALDQAALDTALRSSPVPKPPASLGDSVSLTASIRFTFG